MSGRNSTVEYRDIPGFPGYRVGDDGSVWSCWGRGCHGRMCGCWTQLKPAVHTTGHLAVTLRRNGGGCRFYVHRLVAVAFLGPVPDGLEVCHNDSNPANNVPGNLRFDTRKNNLADRVAVGTMNWGERQGHAKLTTAEVLSIRADHAAGLESYASLGQRHGVDHSTIYAIIKRKSWKHVA